MEDPIIVIPQASANPKNQADERMVLEKSVESGRCYLIDRGYEKYSLWNAIHSVGSDYVCRVRDSATYAVTTEKPLTDADRAANVISDQIIQFGTPNSRTKPPTHTTRLVIVKTTPHDSRRTQSGASGPSSDGYLRIVTNNQTAPAAIIATIMILSITGKSPTKRTFEMISFYLLGWASLDELMAHIEKLKSK